MRRVAVWMILLGLLAVLVACSGGGADPAPLPTRFELATPGDTTATASPAPVTASPAAGIAQVASQTPAAPAPGVTSTPTDFSTPTVTPSQTITDTPTPTDTATPIPTLDPGPIDFLAEIARNATILPPDFRGTSGPPTVAPVTLPPGLTPTATSPVNACQYLPAGGFGVLLLNRPDLVTQIGCPLGTPPDTLSLGGAYQPFEGGAMFWLNEGPGYITVLYADGRFQRVEDTFSEGVDPESGGETPPAGRFEPVRGFGKVWRVNLGVRDVLGWATQTEAGTQATVQDFASGRMIYLPARGDLLILTYTGSPAAGTWQSSPGTF